MFGYVCRQQFYYLQMQQIGAINRRKSYGGVEPVLPRKTFTRQSGTRTLYKQLPAPTQQLKTYRRRLVFDSLPSLETYDSIHSLSSRAQSNGYQIMKQQTLNKNNQTLVTMGSETEFKTHEKSRVSQTSQNKGQQMPLNPTNQEQGEQQIGSHDIVLNIDDDNNQNNQRGDEEIQGYEMGEQVGELEEEMQDKNKFVPKLKSYSTSQKHHLGDVVNKYLPHSEAEARMELKYLSAKFEHVRARREDNEFLGMINQYKANKKAILKQTSRKLQTLKTLATMRRAASLPKLNKIQNDRIQQIVVPSYQQLINPDGNPEQLKRKLLAKRLEGSMSFGRLHISNSNQKRKDGYQAILEQELGYVQQTEKYLREKGIKINSNILKNSLLNLRQIPLQSQTQKQYPIPQLVSNPFHPKQAAKKKKK